MTKKKDIFDKCVCCGCTVYVDGCGDDVIPTGYWKDDEGYVCEDCNFDGGDDDEM